MTELPKSRKFMVVDTNKIHPSRLLPKRDPDPKLVETVKRDGIQQPIIVRPSPYEGSMYEIIDGHIRCIALHGDQKVLVDVRFNVDDAEAFRISEATFKRKPRNTYERALFYNSWVKTVEAKHGSRGAQAKVGQEANLSQAEVSQYLSICKLFERLQSDSVSEEIFNALKNQSVNKLYALSNVEDEKTLLEVATKMAERPKMKLKELKDLIEEQSPPEPMLEDLVEDKEEEKEIENYRMDQLKNAAQELEGTVGKTNRTLTALKSTITDNPRMFLFPDVFKTISRMLNALRRIDREANHIIATMKKTNDSREQTGA
jgi:ParB/RepB/Spo0J family partition protein